jgi:glucose/arabinose dehydrogenase
MTLANHIIHGFRKAADILSVSSRIAGCAVLLAGPAARADFTLEKIAGGFDKPLWVGAPAGAKKHIAVAEQTGRVWLIDRATGQKLPKPFLDLTGSAVRSESEQGLLGLAYPKDFFQSGRFYVNYTDGKGDTHISRFRVALENRVECDPATEEKLLFIDQPYGNHNGGWIEIGPDGMLYIGTGDGGAANDPPDNGQKLSTHLGKILRIDVSPEKGYKVPADNPYVGRSDAKPEIWMWGLRNPWRCSFDRKTKDLWIGDVGQNKLEEVNFVPAGKGKGWNFGWRLREGSIETPGGGVGGRKPKDAVDPIWEYPHDGGPGGGFSVTGGYVYRGPIAKIQGQYFVADYQLPRLWSFQQKNGRAGKVTEWHDKLKEAGVRMISSFGEDPEGNLLLTDHATGSIFRFAEEK